MTPERDIDRLLDIWFRDGPTEAPDRIIDAVADRIGRQSQRRSWRLHWRLTHMTTTIKLAAALLAVAIVALVSWQLLPSSSDKVGGGPIPGQSASPHSSPSVGPTPSPYCEDLLPGCAGLLPAGSHRSNQLVPAISYETPDGWRNVIDLPDVYKLDPPGAVSPYILVWTHAAISDQTTRCSLDPDPNRGRSAADWIAFLTSHPGLDASEPIDIDFGGVTGQQVELAVAADWTETCPNHDKPYVILLTQPVDGRPGEYGLPADQRVLMTVVDVGGRTVVIESYGDQSPVMFASSIAAAKALIATFRFD